LSVSHGPLSTYLGIQGGAFAGGIHAGDGESVTTTFSIDNEFNAFGGFAGPFATLAVEFGRLKTHLSVDSPLLSIGEAARPKSGLALTLGIGCEF